MNAEIKNTCECCGEETTEALTPYSTYYAGQGWYNEMCCRECMEETARLEEEIARDERENEARQEIVYRERFEREERMREEEEEEDE